MKNRWLLVAGGLLASFALQAATLDADSSIELMALDGKAITKQDLAQGKLVDISAGEHQVVYRFNTSLRDGSSNRMMSVTPNVSMINFKADDELTITLPRFSAYAQAQAYFRRGAEWKLEDAQGNERELNYEELPGQGFMPYSDIEKPLAVYNMGKANQYAPQGAAKVLADEVVLGGNDLALLNTFKLMYGNATAEQKKQIRDWLATQD
jgi:uncharacterized protein YccT (UPF0319 family)